MRLIRPISEDEMIAVYLKTEIASERFGADILALLERDRKSRIIIEEPDNADAEANAYRRALLGDFRGYGRNRDMFEAFPRDVAWYRAATGRDELAQVKYIHYSYWNEITGGSRLPADAARTIRSGRKIYGVSNDGFLTMADALRAGARFPEMILVGTSPEAGMTVMEGHARLTAYFLAPESIPEELGVIAGFSPIWGSGKNIE